MWAYGLCRVSEYQEYSYLTTDDTIHRGEAINFLNACAASAYSGILCSVHLRKGFELNYLVLSTA